MQIGQLRIQTTDAAVATAFAELSSQDKIDLADGIKITVIDRYVERHFDVSEYIVQLAMAAPVTIVATVIAERIVDFLRRRLDDKATVVFENVTITVDNIERLNLSLERSVEESRTHSTSQGEA